MGIGWGSDAGPRLRGREPGARRLARRSPPRAAAWCSGRSCPRGPGSVTSTSCIRRAGWSAATSRRSRRSDAGAHALVTTPAASKVYRTTGAVARQVQRLRVAGGATLEWLPQDYHLRRRAGGAGDPRRAGRRRPVHRHRAVCFGPPAGRAPFERGWCRQAFESARAGRPLLDRARTPSSGAATSTRALGTGRRERARRS